MSRIMIVDDVKENISLLDKIFNSYNYDVRVFTNPINALRALKEVEPDLILLDINMPQMGGFEVCKIIKSSNETKDIPVIFLTAQSDKESKIKAFEYGGVDYITKPFVIEELEARVKTHLKMSEMRKELMNTNAKLEEKVYSRTMKMFEELEERKKLEEKLRLAVDEAQEANRAKTLFMANMSHELRTPMNGIFGMTELLKMSGLNEEQNDYVNMISEAGDNLIRIINNLLDWERIEKGDTEKCDEIFSIRELLKNIVLTYSKKAEQKGLKITLEIEEEVDENICADKERIKVIADNIISNAVKFTEHGNVEVTAAIESESDEQVLRVTVNDTGKGMSKEESERIFSPFVQGDLSYTKRYQGIGLGLLLSRKYAKILGGEITFFTEEGKGSRFLIRIPIKSENGKTKINNCEVKKEEKSVEQIKFNVKKILIAEDNPINMTMAKRLVKKAGDFEIIEAENGEIAVELYKKEKPELVLMDIQMPVMNGIEAFKAIRELNKDVKVIAVTAYASDSDKERFFELGMDGYLAKPYKYEELVKSLQL